MSRLFQGPAAGLEAPHSSQAHGATGEVGDGQGAFGGVEERVPTPKLYEHGRRPTMAEVVARAQRCDGAKSRSAEQTEQNPMTLGSVAGGRAG
jgi:hypothetical protein